MTIADRLRPAVPWFLLIAGVVLLAVSGSLTVIHASAVRDMRDIAVPAAARLPALERRLALLTEQAELAELAASMRVGSQEEQVHVYVLPEEPDFGRAVAFFAAVEEHFKNTDALGTFEPLDMGDASVPGEDGLARRPIHTAAVLRDDAADDLQRLIALAGTVTVGDALTAAERAELLRRTEDENPAGIVALEQFFSSDLLLYARDPRAMEDQLLRSLGSDMFSTALQNVAQSSRLRDARLLLGGDLGKALEEQRLWPLPFLTLDHVDIEATRSAGWVHVTLELSMVHRAAN